MDRIALVIGNAAYPQGRELKNPRNDARDIANVLQRLNFDVTIVLDAKLIDIQNAVNIFLRDLDENAVGLLFYAGHGMQIDGKNYIIPVDFESGEKSKTIVSSYCVNSFLDGVSSYKGKTIICILDACRNNPYANGRGLSIGFAPFANPPKGTIIAYSTSADGTASDGKGSNGLYTEVLKEALLIPNLKIEEMFKSVRNKVSDLSISECGEEQLSWEYSSLVGDFYFSVKPQPVDKFVSDEEIYEFICKCREKYENESENIYDIECMPYVEAYEKYHIPVIKMLRAYSRIDYQKQGYHFSDETIYQLNIDYLSTWGFVKKFERWYYKEHYVEMGDLLPLPEELKPKQPIEGMGLKIEATLTAELKNGKTRFEVYSNIPSETPIIFSLSGRKYNAQCKNVAEERTFSSSWFSDKGQGLKDGYYTLDITCPIGNVLPENVKKVFGDRSRNIYGKYVKFDPIGGNRIHFSYGVVIEKNTVKILDMQKSISEFS